MMGKDGSAYAIIYGTVSAHNPSVVYGYFCVSYVSLFLLTLYGIMRVLRRQYKKQISVCVWILLYQALWYAIANIQGVDYRYGLLNIAIFSIFALFLSYFSIFAQLSDLKFPQ